jgi:hypothetical protein
MLSVAQAEAFASDEFSIRRGAGAACFCSAAVLPGQGERVAKALRCRTISGTFNPRRQDRQSIAFSREVDLSGSREENASKVKCFEET